MQFDCRIFVQMGLQPVTKPDDLVGQTDSHVGPRKSPQLQRYLGTSQSQRGFGGRLGAATLGKQRAY